MIEEKCKICGQEHKMLYEVTDKYGYYYKVCEMCYNARMSDADRLLRLEAKKNRRNNACIKQLSKK